MKISLSRILAIDSLIRHKSTGSPEKFALHLGISKRTLHVTLSYMKEAFNAPIYYNRVKETYSYVEEGFIMIKFQRGKPSSKDVYETSLMGV